MGTADERHVVQAPVRYAGQRSSAIEDQTTVVGGVIKGEAAQDRRADGPVTAFVTEVQLEGPARPKTYRPSLDAVPPLRT
jgi:hypothetical protein